MPWSRGTKAGISWVSIVAAVLALALTATLSFATYTLNRHNEHRLLDLQVKQTATVLQVALPGIETPLASGIEIAVANNGSADAFRSYMSSYVGIAPKPFVGAGLWRVTGRAVTQLASTGRPLVLPTTPSRFDSTLVGATKQASVMVIGPLAVSQPQPRIGYTFAAGGYVVYAEGPLPKGRTATIQPGSPFEDLRFALYLGRSTSSEAMLETNVDKLPVSGDTATATAPFGSSVLTLVATTDRQLGGGLSGSLWWIVILVGLVLTGLIAGTAERLVRRRRRAEGLTADTREELAEQRSIATTLQRALLPETLPTLPGLLADARYATGVEGVDIGGDWYDLLTLDDHRVFFVIGDVSGRGVPAGTTMAALRFAVRAFVHEGHPPATVLDRMVGLIDVTRERQFATVLCGVLDLERHEITFASAGHLPPLVIADGVARSLDVTPGAPIGVIPSGPYETATVRLPAGGMLLAFTDGLIERPGESLDVSLEHLRSVVGTATTLTDVFDRVVPGLTADSKDDIAILGVQWLT